MADLARQRNECLCKTLKEQAELHWDSEKLT